MQHKHKYQGLVIYPNHILSEMSRTQSSKSKIPQKPFRWCSAQTPQHDESTDYEAMRGNTYLTSPLGGWPNCDYSFDRAAGVKISQMSFMYGSGSRVRRQHKCYEFSKNFCFQYDCAPVN